MEKGTKLATMPSAGKSSSRLPPTNGNTSERTHTSFADLEKIIDNLRADLTPRLNASIMDQMERLNIDRSGIVSTPYPLTGVEGDTLLDMFARALEVVQWEINRAQDNINAVNQNLWPH